MRPAHVPSDAQWLAGEGAGSWFVLRWAGDLLSAERLSPEGDRECQGMFELCGADMLDRTVPMMVTYPSHCALITILQSGRTITYRRVDREEK